MPSSNRTPVMSITVSIKNTIQLFGKQVIGAARSGHIIASPWRLWHPQAQGKPPEPTNPCEAECKSTLPRRTEAAGEASVW
jgi:hypothetical protein